MVLDGPNCEWANGEYERIEAKNGCGSKGRLSYELGREGSGKRDRLVNYVDVVVA
jgi:hypothetical protein